MSETVLEGRRAERRELRRATRRRVRGGERRAPVPVQRMARRAQGTAAAAREAGATAISGDRPYALGLLGVVILGVLTVSGPFQDFLDGRARVELLQAKADALAEENAELAQRKADLQDPATLELMAREQQGMIRPGEVPYAIVPPEVERPRIAPAREVTLGDAPWYRRMWETVTGLFS